MNTIKSALRTLFVAVLHLDIPPSEVGELNLIATLGIDSLAAMEIITRVENQFNIRIDDTDVSPVLVDSLATLEAYIVKKQAIQ